MPSRHQAPIQTVPRTSCSSGNLSVPGMSMSPTSHRTAPGRNSRESGTSAGLWKGVPFSTYGLPRVVHRSEEHTSELQSLAYLVCRLLLEKKKNHTGARQSSLL